MVIQYSYFDIILYILLYSFLGWVIEVCYLAVKEKRFCNIGFINMPFCMTYGITFALLMVTLPTLKGSYVFSFIVTVVVVAVVENLSRLILKRISHEQLWQDDANRVFSGSGRGLIISLLIAGGYYLVYLVIHPLMLGLIYLIPDMVVKVIVYIAILLLVLDYVSVFLAVHSGNVKLLKKNKLNMARRNLGNRITDAIWGRLQRAYPGIREMDEEERAGIVFAKGVCFDKLIWVFLTSAFMGDIIETVYCRIVGGTWMNRSSVLYGPFSFVWGFGAVLLTITLQKLAGKEDRHVFFAGFFIGGVYEYMCSVFTELVFGTVFWDYSHMPLNIGGRTNVLFCMFWGILSVGWVKIAYPTMSRNIEKLPPLTGKIITWIVILFMVCNGVLTAAAMIRYTARQTNPEPGNMMEEFLDEQYDDEFVENRWPNMVVKE